MSDKVKDIGIKNRKYYFLDVINIKHFHPNNNKMHEKSYKIFLFTTSDN